MGFLLNTLKGTFRIAQTTSVLAKTGSKWLVGERPPNPQLLRNVFEELGATYIKLGQFIASSPTFFPKDYVEEFQNCLDKTKPFPFSIAKKIIEQELACSIDKVYSYSQASKKSICTFIQREIVSFLNPRNFNEYYDNKKISNSLSFNLSSIEIHSLTKI